MLEKQKQTGISTEKSIKAGMSSSLPVTEPDGSRMSFRVSSRIDGYMLHSSFRGLSLKTQPGCWGSAVAVCGERDRLYNRFNSPGEGVTYRWIDCGCDDKPASPATRLQT